MRRILKYILTVVLIALICNPAEAAEQKKENTAEDKGNESASTEKEAEPEPAEPYREGNVDVILDPKPDKTDQKVLPNTPQTDDGRPFIISRIPLWVHTYVDAQTMLDIAFDATPMGDSGRLYIPEVGVNVAVNFASEYDSTTAQAIGDAVDSAVYTTHMNGEPYIADHSTQEFYRIRSCHEGTLAYWKHVDRLDILYCTRVCSGENDGRFIYTSLKENAYYINEGGLFMYTCNEDWEHVTVVFWQPIGTYWL